jgi:hypothetical protein
MLRVLKERCVSGERGRGAAAFGVLDVDGLGFGVAADVDGGGGGGRADIFLLMLSSLLVLVFFFAS